MTVDISELDRAAIALERDRWTIIVREAIRDSLLIRGSVHADNLASLGIPDDHKNCIGAELGNWVRRGLVYEAERRPAKATASHSRKSGVYKPTAKGVTKLIGRDAAPVEQSATVGTGNAGSVSSGETAGVESEQPQGAHGPAPTVTGIGSGTLDPSGFKRAATVVPPQDGLSWGLCWSWVSGEPPAFWRRDLTAVERQGTLA